MTSVPLTAVLLTAFALLPAASAGVGPDIDVHVLPPGVSGVASEPPAMSGTLTWTPAGQSTWFTWTADYDPDPYNVYNGHYIGDYWLDKIVLGDGHDLCFSWNDFDAGTYQSFFVSSHPRGGTFRALLAVHSDSWLDECAMGDWPFGESTGVAWTTFDVSFPNPDTVVVTFAHTYAGSPCDTRGPMAYPAVMYGLINSQNILSNPEFSPLATIIGATVVGVPPGNPSPACMASIGLPKVQV